jgi:4'-phosphopantetheinyl transferase
MWRALGSSAVKPCPASPGLRWPVGSRPARLAGGEAEVWSASLERPARTLEALASLLAPDERARAARFHFERDRNRYVVGRALLRVILGRHLQTEAATVSFRYDRHGKPRLDSPWQASGLEFNVSHSGSVALFAIARDRRVGVDVELVRPLDDAPGLAESAFSAAEVAALRALPPGRFLDGFFACWTRKEAFVKARGEGLSLALDAFDVSVDPESEAELIATRFDPEEAGRWTLRSLDPGPGLAGAVAVEGARPPVTLRRWEDEDEAP